jgi:signal transduction histidine kinase
MESFLKAYIEARDKLVDSLGGRNIILLAVTISLAIVMMIVNDRWIMSAKDVNDEIELYNTMQLEATAIQKNINEAESAQRGFLLTADKKYLTPYDQSIIDLRLILKSLENHLEELNYIAPIEEEKLHELLSASAEAKIAEMDLTLSFAEKGDFNEAKKVVALNSGLSEMQSITQNTDKLNAIIEQRMADMHIKRIKTRNLVRASIILGPLLLILLVTLVIKALLNELKVKGDLQAKLKNENQIHEETLKKQSGLLQQLALDYQSDVERERHTLATELHDELGSILTATKMDIAWIIKKLTAADPLVLEKLKRTSGYLDQGINFKRQIVQNLHPSMIGTFGFWPALKTLIDETAERNQLSLTANLPNDDTQINETVSLIAYRVIQETLNNCTKYANATTLRVDIVCDAQNIKIEIQDNGVGVDLSSLTGATHGLNGMRNRVLAIGGRIEFTSQPGQGLLTFVILPLHT